MKTNNILRKVLSAVALLCCFSTAAWAQTINNDYSSSTIQHKKAKWYNWRGSISTAAKNMDTFNDEDDMFENPYTNTPIQATHVYYDTLYVRKGDNVTLTLPLVSQSYNASSNKQVSAQAYQRWYNFVTEGTFSYTQDGRTQDILSPSSNCRRYANGYVAGTAVNNVSMATVTFHYPTDNEYSSYSRNGFDNGSAGNDYYLVVCDASGYLDFTSNGTKGSFSSDNGWYEPTLSLRAIYYIIGVDDDVSSQAWENGMGRLNNPDYYGGTDESKRFLEEYDIIFPCDHLGNQSDELVSLSKFAHGYRINGDSNDDLTIKIIEGEDVFTLLSFTNERGTEIENDRQGGCGTREVGNQTTISGDTRSIFFRKKNAGKQKPWSVNDGQKATIVVTKTVKGITYNIARFHLTFSKDTRLLTQHELNRLDKLRMGDSSAGNISQENWYKSSYQYRTPEYLRNNYTLLTSRTFDYDPTVAGTGGGQDWYYPFPLDWKYSSYAFFDGSTTTNFDGSTDNNSAYNKEPFAEWGYYTITNNYVGYGDIYKNTSAPRPTNPSLGGKNGDGYFLYIDASDKPGTIVTLPFTENLCAGTELFVSAWVKSADENANNRANSAMLFTIYGVDKDGNKTPLYSQSTGQITTTSFLSTDDGNEYTNTNGYGSSQNDWYQIYFSFVNNSDLTGKFVSYELKVDNNCGSTAGGDFYLDEIEVFIAQPTATVTQKDYACSGERTLLSASLDWEQLCERLGLEADETDENKEPENIDFCFIDEAKYNALIGNNPENASVDQIEAALKQSVANIGIGTEDADRQYDKEIASLYYHLAFDQNTEYKPNEDNLLVDNQQEQGKYFFYQTGTKDDGNRRLICDFYSAMSPNKRYLMLILDGKSDGTTNTFDDFADMMYDPCGIQSPVYVTAQTLVKINGEIVDPENDLCEGQTFNFTSQMRVPELDENGEIKRDPNTGEEMYETLDMDVYFDWFFGTEEEFNAANPNFNGVSLQSALSTMRDILAYRNVENLDGVTPQPEGEGHSEFTQDDINIIQHYLGQPGPEGSHNNKLVLHRQALDIAILSTGLDLVISPIPVVKPADSDISDARWDKICWEYVPLQLNASGKSPRLFAGRNMTEYPEGLNPGLRIGLEQIKAAAYTQHGGKNVRISLRGAEYTDDNVDHLGLIESTGDIDYTQIYLIDTNDPRYTSLVHVENFDQYRYPIGKINSLYAEKYVTGSQFNDAAEIQFYLDEQTLANGEKFTFEPREGYFYRFSVNFAEKGNEANNSCWGSFPMEMKVVPKYLVWNGTETDNWNNDGKWKRAKAADLNFNGNTYTDYPDNELTDTGNGYVPMLFSNVVMPKGSKAELYMAGYGDGGAWQGQDQGTKPDHIGDPTQDIQYDLMVYDTDPDTHSNDLTTQRFRVNICNDIHFAPGAQMLHAEQLLYNKAWMDVNLPTRQWTLVSTPLKDVVSGDWYTSTTGTQTDLPYFEDITFGQNNDRRNPSVYQRSWDKNATIVSSPINNGGNGIVGFDVSTPVWSAAYNDASVAYLPGGGYSLSARDVTGGTGTLNFRFPKADEKYDISTGTFTRDNYGKLFISDLLDRSNPQKLVKNDDITQTLTASQDGKYMIVGNPYMAPLDLQKFFEVNAGTDGNLTGQYWSETSEGSAMGGTDATGGKWLTPTGTETIAPFGAFFVQLKDGETNQTIKFTADMQKFEQVQGEGTAFTITADNGSEKSRAILAYADNANNDYADTEDTQLMRDLLGNNANELSVYTVAGDVAASINRVKDLQKIPLGLFATEDAQTTLTFKGVSTLKEPTLYDALENTSTPITEGMTLAINGSSHGRYYICSLGEGNGTTGIDEITSTEEDVKVTSPAHRQIMVTSNNGIESVSVYSANGTLLRRVSPKGETTCTIDGVASGVAVVIVKTASNNETSKIIIK